MGRTTAFAVASLWTMWAISGCSSAKVDTVADAATDVAVETSADSDEPPPVCPAPLGVAKPRPAKKPLGYPLDDVLRINHVQVEATHNSYHLRPKKADLVDWDYEHAPLATQLSDQGVRGLEIDVHWNYECKRFEVYHIGIFDDQSSCRLFTDCLQVIRNWSDAHQGHHVLFIQIEPKSGFDPGTEADRMAALEAEIRSVYPLDSIVTPDEVKGASASLRAAILERGWPTLGASRGRVMFMLNEDGPTRKAYTRGDKNLDGRLVFAQAEAGSPYEAVRILNDAVGAKAQVEAAVKSGFLVRVFGLSREGAVSGNRTELDTALAGGAQILSTDWPAKVPGISLFLEIPGGTPSRCNPLIAPTGCTSSAIESPDRLKIP